MKDFAMFTAEGNELVTRIATAGLQLTAEDGAESASPESPDACVLLAEDAAA